MELLNEFFNEVKIFHLEKFEDNRGFFLEKYHTKRYQKHGIDEIFVQDNHSRSYKNVLRGLHFTQNKPQSQIMTVISGKVFDVVVDIRPNSKTFGKYASCYLGDEGPQQIYMPDGFAHGFCVLSDIADLHYKVSKIYNSSHEKGIIWNDEIINVDWPITNPIISERDLNHPTLEEYFL